MAVPEDISSIICGHSQLYVLAVDMICAAGLWATLPLEMTSAGQQSDLKPALTVERDVQAGKAMLEQHCVTCRATTSDVHEKPAHKKKPLEGLKGLMLHHRKN